jgi:hypothetical protein
MSYEKFKVKSVDSRKNNETGEVIRFVEVERVVTQRLNFKTAAQFENLPVYESLVGKEVLIQIREGVMEGRPWVAFDGDGLPIDLSLMVPRSNSVKDEPKSGSVKPFNPLDGMSNKAA